MERSAVGARIARDQMEAIPPRCRPSALWGIARNARSYGAIFLLLLAGCATPPPPAPPPPQATAAYDQAFDDVMAHYGVPGLAVGVIENGKVVYTRTAGELVAGGGEPVDRQTLFKIASNSKAMTAALLARFVDRGLLRWDDPVTRHLPQFRMHDAWVTEHMQVRDLLIHNSGLPEGAGDLMLWPEPNAFTREDIIRGLAFLEPEYGFRAGYAYDNLLYVVAGEVAAAVGGESYEELVRREVFEPLGLDCRVGSWPVEAGRIAQPHVRLDGINVPVRTDGPVVAPITSAAAGGIRCSLEAMLTWALNWLDPTDAQLAWLSEAQRRELWAARTPMPISARRREWDDTHYYAYALGFRVADVDGAWTVSHTGTLMGMYSAMTLLPDAASGFVLMMNGGGGQARTVLNDVLLKQFTAPDQGRTVAWYTDALDAAYRSMQGGDGALPDTSARAPVQAGGLPLGTGVWRDPWFGEVAVCEDNGSVRFASAKSPLLTGTVMRVGERHLVDWDDASVDVEAWLEFSTRENGSRRLTMAKVDPDADFSFDYEDLDFTRVRDCD